jgi:hypothetical protein
VLISVSFHHIAIETVCLAGQLLPSGLSVCAVNDVPPVCYCQKKKFWSQ